MRKANIQRKEKKIMKLLPIAQAIADGTPIKVIAAQLNYSRSQMQHFIIDMKEHFEASDTPNLIAILFRRKLIK